jgi:hypothetical protein
VILSSICVNSFTLYVIADIILSACDGIIDTTSLVRSTVVDTIRPALRAVIEMVSPIRRDFHPEPLEDVIPTGDEKKEGELPTFTSYDLLIGLTMCLVTGYILYLLSGE